MSMLGRSSIFSVMLLATLAHAEPGAGKDDTNARAHFNEGLVHAARGELSSALLDFEAAYALQPHYSVLYNIGQAQAALGRSAEAVRSFERYLADGGESVSTERRSEVLTLIAVHRARVGELKVVGATASTRVWLDGIEVAPPDLNRPILVTQGKHTLLSSNGGGFPISQEVSVSALSQIEQRLPAAPPPAAEGGKLLVSCRVPGVAVQVAGLVMVTTPIAWPLDLPAGTAFVAFTRAGYQRIHRSVVITSRRTSVVDCDQKVDRALAPELRALLSVQTTPTDAEIFIDGDGFLGAPIPSGPHKLSVQRDGFISQTQTISLRARDTNAYRVNLTETPSHLARGSKATAHRGTFGFAAVGGALAFALAGGALLVWDGKRYDDWHANQSSMDTTSQLRTATSIQRVDDIAFGCLALGTGLLVTGTWLLLTKPSQSE
jgi:hypothetical protein